MSSSFLFPYGQKLLKNGKNESSEFNYQALSCEGQLWKMKFKIRLFVIPLMGLKSLLLENTKWDPFELTAVFILPMCISWHYKNAETSESRNSFFPLTSPGWNSCLWDPFHSLTQRARPDPLTHESTAVTAGRAHPAPGDTADGGRASSEMQRMGTWGGRRRVNTSLFPLTRPPNWCL